MAGNHKQYSYSVKNLLFCPKMTAMKQGKPFSNSFGYNSERRLSQPNSLRKSIQAGGSVNLPPVEHSSHRSRRKHCNALDLLQLMKDCEQARSPSKANCSSHYCNYSGKRLKLFLSWIDFDDTTMESKTYWISGYVLKRIFAKPFRIITKFTRLLHCCIILNTDLRQHRENKLLKSTT